MSLRLPTEAPPENGHLSVYMLAAVTGFTPTFLRRCVKNNRFKLGDMASRESGVLLFKATKDLKTFIDQQRARRAHLTKHTQTELP